MKTFTEQEVKAALLSNDLRSAQIMLDANEKHFTARIEDAKSNANELNNRLNRLLAPSIERARWEALSPEEQQAERDQQRAEHKAWEAKFHAALTRSLNALAR
tara:strand:- start:12 stop:320 length:309 start_codon:yes stop_codon:yes gene_type:complete